VVLRGSCLYVAEAKRALRLTEGHTYWKEWQANRTDIYLFNAGSSILPKTLDWNVISARDENISAESNIWVQPSLTVVSFCTIVNLSDIENKRAKHGTDMYKYGLKESGVMLLTGPLRICQ